MFNKYIANLQKQISVTSELLENLSEQRRIIEDQKNAIQKYLDKYSVDPSYPCYEDAD
jgi:uncharacterized protein (DUF3084 family)